MHVYEVRPRKDRRSVNLISDALPFGRLCHEQASDALERAKFYSPSHDGDAQRQPKCGITKRATVQRRKCLTQRH
jgi:hypothetical protein